MSRQIAAVLVVGMLLLSGCAGVLPGGDEGGQAQPGSMQFYVSDQANAIDDFQSLNATVTQVGLHRVGNDTSEGEWVTYDVENVTLDLTQLQGQNATQIANVSVPNGTYDKVFVNVSAVNGRLTSGERANVTLPSDRLRLNQRFTVGSGEQFHFVYDMSVVSAGQSGKYVLKPVASQSGKDREVRQTNARVGHRGQGGGSGQGQSGRMQFYLSDEQNAMDQFRYLNVTVTRVGFHRVDANGTNGTWVEHDVDDRTVDLTELQGANATQIDDTELPNGTYDKVFVYVGHVDGMLDSGETVNVKLPSSKLHVNSNFTVGSGENVSFVYDMSVFEAGKSGKYVLKPVVSHSGTDEPIQPVGLRARFVGQVAAGQDATVRVTAGGSPVEGATVTYRETTYETDDEGVVSVPVPDDATSVELTVDYQDEQVTLRRQLQQTGTATSTPTTTTTTTTSG